MGARLEEYKKVAPDFSFIHVDQFSGPSELAQYLHQLDQDDEKYNQYFQAGHPHPPHIDILLFHITVEGQRRIHQYPVFLSCLCLTSLQKGSITQLILKCN